MTAPPVVREVLVLPCRHLTDRPNRRHATAICGTCGKRFTLRLVEGGRAWNATEEET